MIGQKTKFDKRVGVPSLQRCDVAFTEVFSKFTQSLGNRSTLRSYSKKLAKDRNEISINIIEDLQHVVEALDVGENGMHFAVVGLKIGKRTESINRFLRK